MWRPAPLPLHSPEHGRVQQLGLGTEARSAVGGLEACREQERPRGCHDSALQARHRVASVLDGAENARPQCGSTAREWRRHAGGASWSAQGERVIEGACECSSGGAGERLPDPSMWADHKAVLGGWMVPICMDDALRLASVPLRWRPRCRPAPQLVAGGLSAMLSAFTCGVDHHLARQGWSTTFVPSFRRDVSHRPPGGLQNTGQVSWPSPQQRQQCCPAEERSCSSGRGGSSTAAAAAQSRHDTRVHQRRPQRKSTATPWLNKDHS